MTQDLFLHHNGATLRWREEGSPGAQPLILLNSLGTDLHMWDPVAILLGADFRILRMDMRGHGQSSSPPGDATMPDLARDACAVLDAAHVSSASFCGLSIGGMIALQLALDAPDRVDALVVANSSAQLPPAPWQDRAALVRGGGMQAVADAVIPRFFSETFRRTESAIVTSTRETLLATDPIGYAAACMAIAGLNLFERLPAINVPLLVINGTHDSATPPADHGDKIAAQVPGARTVALPAGHLAAVECPGSFATAVASFLSEQAAAAR